jgi:type VI secretion system secreted protein VgrG
MQTNQSNSLYEVLVPHLGKDKFTFQSVEGKEFVSKPFEFRVRMATADGAIDDEDLLRKPIRLTIRRAGGFERQIHALIQSSRLVGKSKETAMVYYWEVTMSPWLWFLNLEVDCRHFINMDAKEIITKVFTDHGYPDFSFKTQATFPKREFTVQYRESSFNFVSRLMEEEGIFYWFEHTEAKHQLILADANSVTQPCPHYDTLPYGQGMSSNHPGGMLEGLEQKVGVHTGKYTLQDFEFSKSSVSLLSSTAGRQRSEIYDYPGKFMTKDQGTRYAKLRLEEQEARLRTIHGNTSAVTLVPGYRMTVEKHFDADVNTSYIVLSSTLAFRQNSQDSDIVGETSSADCDFSAIPFRVPYRPPKRHEKPLIHGVQTAIVCGPAGSEIHCDNFGRVKVQFHWDRIGTKKDNSSHWIRITNSWAGGNWGQISIPRVGQEVIVSFLEGDPDRPIITGCVYNDQQMPPYSLPDNKTQSGIKSRSSPGGGASDFNEFRFEDKKGSEQVYLHAQKDFDELIENKHTTTVQKSDQIITLDQGNQKTKVSQGNRDITVSLGNNKLECPAGKISESAAQEIKMECTPSKITMTPTSIKIEIGASSIELTPANITMKSPMILQN